MSNRVIAKKRKALIEQLKDFPVLFKVIEDVKSVSDDEFMRAYSHLSDNPDLLHLLSRINAHHSHESPTQPAPQQSTQRDPIQVAHKKNDKWFRHNKPEQRNDRMRASFSEISNLHNNKSYKCILYRYIKSMMDDDSETDIYRIFDEVHSFLQRNNVNLIHIDMDVLTDLMLQEMRNDDEWCIKNILDQDVLDLNDPKCLMNYFIENTYYGNNNNITDMNKGSSMQYWENTNTTLIHNALDVGDIFVLISDTMRAGFSECYYILDFNHKLRKIGMRQYASQHHDTHIIIPIHITNTLYDPIKSYSTFIHQHCYETGGTIQLELQIANDSHIFHEDHTTLSDKQQKDLITHYGWKQNHHSGGGREPVDHVMSDIRDNYNHKQYSTVYVVTDMGYSGCLIGYCNHPNVDRLNLSLLVHNAENGYATRYNGNMERKAFTEKQFDMLLAGMWKECVGIKVESTVNVKIADFYTKRTLWKCDPGLELRNNLDKNTDLIVYTAKHKSSKGTLLNAISIDTFSSMINNDVELHIIPKRDDGIIRMGLIKVDDVCMLNGWIQDCIEGCTYGYDTLGGFYKNGKKYKLKQKTKLLDALSVNQIGMKLDFKNQEFVCTFYYSKKKKMVPNTIKFPIESNVEYKFFVAMCWKKDYLAYRFE